MFKFTSLIFINTVQQYNLTCKILFKLPPTLNNEVHLDGTDIFKSGWSKSTTCVSLDGVEGSYVEYVFKQNSERIVEYTLHSQ